MNPANMFKPNTLYPTYCLRDPAPAPQNYPLAGTALTHAVISTETGRVLGLFPSFHWASRFVEQLNTNTKIKEIAA